MMVWATLLLAFAAFTAIAASMDRHTDQLGTDTLGARQSMGWRLSGYALLAVSLLPCLVRSSPSLALATWLGALTFSAGALGLLLTYAPQRAKRTALTTGTLGLLLLMLSNI